MKNSARKKKEIILWLVKIPRLQGIPFLLASHGKYTKSTIIAEHLNRSFKIDPTK